MDLLATISKERFAAARELHDEVVRRAVESERARCISIVEQATANDEIQSCGSAIVFIREGILEIPEPEEYERPALRILVQTMRDGVRQVAERRQLETTNA